MNFKKEYLLNTKESRISLDHGAGGQISHALIEHVIRPFFDNPELNRQDDGAVLDLVGLSPEGRLAFSTDSYVIDPIFFPGGNIGDLSVNGTVNDVAMCGATPLYISTGLIIEEGFPLADLMTILESMACAADKAGIKIVTGDTKVVPRGKADKIFINTSGIGVIPPEVHVSGSAAQPGDQIIISGNIADHGTAVISAREGLIFDINIKSDSAPLNHMVADLIGSGCDIHVLRDPTRGGVGTTLKEIAIQSHQGIKIFENTLPIRRAVRSCCELFGFDPLYLANEGKALVFVPERDAAKALAIIQSNEFGKDAAIIGEVVDDNKGKVFLETSIGGLRIIDMLTGEQLPRIC